MKTILSGIVLFFLVAFLNATTSNNSLANRNPRTGTEFIKFKEYKKELERILPLAEKGDPFLQNKVGWFYDQGLGTEGNPREALKWYLKSAEQGFRQAQVNAGALLEMGRGTPKNLEQANYWYSKAHEE